MSGDWRSGNCSSMVGGHRRNPLGPGKRAGPVLTVISPMTVNAADCSGSGGDGRRPRYGELAGLGPEVVKGLRFVWRMWQPYLR